MNFNLEIVDEVLILQLEGDLIGEKGGAEIVESIGQKISEGFKYAIVDIADVRYINSSGIGVLITLLTKFRNQNGELILIHPSEHVKKLLIITKLNNIFNIEESLEAAFEKVNQNK